MYVLAKPRTKNSKNVESSVFDFVKDTENGEYLLFDTLAEARAYEAVWFPNGTHFIFELVG